jgi:protein tyrosine phosphatase
MDSNISSAGIGRSGVFIALYYLLEAIEFGQMLNVKQLVDTMRLYRPHLVQTIVYIQFIHEIFGKFEIFCI